MESGNNYFTISPMTNRMESLEPGGTYTGSVTVINPAGSTDDLHYSVRIAPYGVKGNNYTADLVTETNYTMIAKWITIDEPTGSLKPNHTKTINYTINVPDNAPAGGQYAAVIVSKDPNSNNEEDNGVSIKDTYEIASLIYADIDGETTHEGEIIDNNIPGFVASPLVTVSTTISNTGNVHEYATIIIKATNSLTGEKIFEPKDKSEYYTELVMPESQRFIQRDVKDNMPQLGLVHVEQTIYYNGQISKQSKDVIVCPIWFLILVIFVLGMLISIIARMFIKHRKKSRAKKAII